MLTEGFYFDDYSHDTKTEYYNFSGGTSITWDKTTNKMDLIMSDGTSVLQDYPKTDDTSMPNSGYIRIKLHCSYSYADDISFFIYVMENSSKYYEFTVAGEEWTDGSALETVAKYDSSYKDQAGPYNGTIVTSSPPASEDIDIEIEAWWSPTYCRMLINDGGTITERTLTPSTDTTEYNIDSIWVYYCEGNFELEEYEVRAWDGKIGQNGNIYHYNFSEMGPVDGLIAYWPMNGDADDYNNSGYQRYGTVISATVDATAPRDRSCYDFTTALARIDLPSYLIMEASSTWSISCWISKSSYGSTDGICGNNITGSLGAIYFTANDGLAIDTVGANVAWTSLSTVFPADEWFNLIITRASDGTAYLYNNGTGVGGSKTTTGAIYLQRLGCTPNASPGIDELDGLMFDCRIYNRVLTSQERNILATMYDTDGATITNSMLGRYAWNTWGQFKEN